MATGPCSSYRNLHPQTILVIINQQLLHGLHQPTGCTFVPELLTAAAVVVGFARFKGFQQCCFIHIGMHQYLAGCSIRGDNGDEPIGVKLRSQEHPFFDCFN